MPDDTADFSEEFRTVEARMRAATEARLEARREAEEAVQIVHGRLVRTGAFEICDFSVKGQSINVVRGQHVIAVIKNVGAQQFEISRPGAGRIAGPISMSGVGEAIAGLVLEGVRPELA